jgi:hypothetical protein
MSLVITGLPTDFCGRLLEGVMVDLEIAAVALVMGLATGLPIAALLVMRGPIRIVPAVAVQLLRAAPTFVMMFFLLDVLPRSIAVAGSHVPISGKTIVALSLLPYSASYVAVSVEDAVRQWWAGSVMSALLLLPNVARAYFVLVMSSGAAATIGVTDGIAVILRQANTMNDLSDRLQLFALGVLVFGAILQTGFFLVNRLRLLLTRRVIDRASAERQRNLE